MLKIFVTIDLIHTILVSIDSIHHRHVNISIESTISVISFILIVVSISDF